MRSTALTALFFALFALFSAVAYAAPVTPQGAIIKRQACSGASCKYAVNSPTTSNSDSTDSAADLMGQIFAAFYNNIMGASNTPNNAPAAAYVASGTSSAPTNNPTGV